jgi:molybdenum cofactor cytidylyltransferase
MSTSQAGSVSAGTRSGPVAGIVLAAGASTRLGRNKLLVQVEGESLLRRTVRRALAVLHPVVVVLGHDAARVREELAGLSCDAVVNEGFARGLGTSVRIGVAALPDAAPAAMVLLADMPFVTTAMIGALAARYRSSDAPLVVSDYQGVTAPPLLYDRSLFPELLELEGDGSGSQVARRHRRQAAVLSWPASALTDLDLPADLDRLGALLALEP